MMIGKNGVLLPCSWVAGVAEGAVAVTMEEVDLEDGIVEEDAGSAMRSEISEDDANLDWHRRPSSLLEGLSVVEVTFGMSQPLNLLTSKR